MAAGAELLHQANNTYLEMLGAGCWCSAVEVGANITWHTASPPCNFSRLSCRYSQDPSIHPDCRPEHAALSMAASTPRPLLQHVTTSLPPAGVWHML